MQQAMTNHLAHVNHLRKKKEAKNDSDYRLKEIERLKKRVQETESLNQELTNLILKK